MLYESTVIMEYLDERFPHPPLLAVYPVARAQSRLLMHRIEKDWSRRVNLLMAGRGRAESLNKARRELGESLLAVAPVFASQPFFMSDEFTLVDCCVAPILWRLRAMDVKLPERSTRAMRQYMRRIVERESFRRSLTEAEVEMRE